VLIPLRHERMRGRRWPIITFALIGLNSLIFLITNGPIHQQQPARTKARIQLLLMAASHPELQMSPQASAYVEAAKKISGEHWDELIDSARTAAKRTPSYAVPEDDSADLQQEMDSICQSFEEHEKNDILGKYAFVPAHPTLISYITANFLHGGWIHLIGNMWFLWLAGFILEDNWGRLIYPIFYLVSGAAAMQFYGWCASGSYMPLVGASGAVAALMGAFLVRFPKLKIEMMFGGLLFRYRFKAEAYWLLPLWLFMEFFYGSVSGTSSPVAHWAHVGGFLFGMLGAYAIKRSGLEQKANEAIEEKIGWSADPEIVRANEALDNSQLDEAAQILENHLKQKPGGIDALDLLQKVHWRRSDMSAYLQATAQLCQAHLKAQNTDAAWADFEAYTQGGGDKLPAASWLEIARLLETQQNLDRAASEYERLADAHPTEKQSILALVAAGRLYLKRLSRPDQALACYEKAASSKVPHLDWQPNIDAGLRDAKAALAVAPVH
jgi:membrane associated rhomboid family serine protease